MYIHTYIRLPCRESCWEQAVEHTPTLRELPHPPTTILSKPFFLSWRFGHSVATDEGNAVPALGDRHVALLGEDVLQVGLREGRGQRQTGVQ